MINHNEEALSFTGIAEIILGHESWSMRSQYRWQDRRIIRFQDGFPVEILVKDSKSFSYSSPDRGYGFEGSSSQTEYQLDWPAVLKQHKPKLVLHCCTRDDGQGQIEKYMLCGKKLRKAITSELLERVYEFDESFK